MSISVASPPSQQPPDPAGARETPAPPHADEAHGEDLDLEEDVAPNLGGEDAMQDA